jgi:septal ring factor EnvC (AmiA/AmiB activator)
MKAKTRVVGLLGALVIGLAACADGTVQTASERDAQVTDLRRQVESLRAQYLAKDQEAKRLAAELAAAKKLEAQVSALEERLRGMQDIVMAKDEQVARLELQLEAATAKKAAPAKKAVPEVSGKGKGKP